MLIPQAARSERGFTLVEALVAILTGVVVTGALFAILEISLHQTALVTDRVQADQTSRGTMTKVVDALHSTCLSPGFTPIQTGSNGSKLIFVNAYSSIAAIPSASEQPAEGPYKHVVEYLSANGTLVDKAYPSTSVASWPKITFNEASFKQTVLGERVSQTSVATPVFQYFKYATKASSESENAAVSTLTPLPTGTLTETQAKEAASVLISFNTKPIDSDVRQSRSVSLSSQVTFALSAPGAEAPITDSPCE